MGLISAGVATFVERYEFGPIDDNILITIFATLVLLMGVHVASCDAAAFVTFRQIATAGPINRANRTVSIQKSPPINQPIRRTLDSIAPLTNPIVGPSLVQSRHPTTRAGSKVAS